MADIRINDLPTETTPTPSEFVAIDGVSTRKATIQNVVNSAAPVASQAKAEGGTDNNDRMTALSTKQAIDYNSVPLSRSVQAGDGLTGGGSLSSNISLNVAAGSGISVTSDAVSLSPETFSRLIPSGGSVNEVLAKNSSSNYDLKWTPAGAGDMLRSTYDPSGANKNAFDGYPVPTISSLKSLNPSLFSSVYVIEPGKENSYIWNNSNLSSQVAADPDQRRYIPPNSDATGTSGAWVLESSVPTGGFALNLSNPPHVKRFAGRFFAGAGAAFSGKWVGYDLLDGIDPLSRALHNWGPRDSSFFWDDAQGAMTVVAQSRTSMATNWPGSPSFVPSSIPISGFAINDRADGQGQAWALYGDAVRMSTGGFTMAAETTVANFGSETIPTTAIWQIPGNQLSVNLWVASGAGLDLVDADLARQGLSSLNVRHMSAWQIFLTSFSRKNAVNWQNSTAYVSGDYRIDPQTDIVYRCIVAHTSPASGTFAQSRSSNNYWRALPGAYKGLLFTVGSLAEQSPGSNVFSAMEMQERSQISWTRINGSGNVEQSGFIWTDFTTDGTSPVGITLKSGFIDHTVGTGGGIGINGLKVVGERQPLIAAPGTDGGSLQTAVNAIRVLLVNHGLMSGS